MRTWGVCAVNNNGNTAVVAIVVVAQLDELLDRVDQHGHRGDVREDSDGDAAAVDPQRLPLVAATAWVRRPRGEVAGVDRCCAQQKKSLM